MANQQQTLYERDVIQLADTLVIKYRAEALAMNKYYLEYHGLDYSDLPEADWPYYRNLSGQYMAGYDTMMRVTSLDTREEIDFTYENLQVHRATLAAYTIGSDYYRALLRRYPNQEHIIRGIINPVPVAKAVAAKDFTILAWDKNYVEAQETNLIPLLQERIDQFVLRWFQSRWTITQSLYAGGFWVQMTYEIIRALFNIRLGNCGTRFVHSYHVWGYLGSFMRLDRWRDYLTTAQAMWLYRNIAVIVNNAGKTGTFESLIENLLTARGIPLTKHEIWHDVSLIPNDIYPTAEIARVPLNRFAIESTGTTRTTISDVLTRELPMARDNEVYYRNQLYAVPLLARSSYVNELPTKVLESKMVDRTENVPFKLSATVFNHWLWLVSKGRYTAEITVTDPTSGAVISLSPKDAVILWIYCCAREYGVELTTIPPIMVHNVMRPMMPSYDELRAAVPETYINRGDILVALDQYAAPGKIISREAFQQYCHLVYDAAQAFRQQVAFCEDPRRRGYMEGMCNRFFLRERVSFVDTPTTYQAWLSLHNLDFSTLDDARVAEFGEDLYATATGTDLKDVTSMKEIQAASIGIMSQLSSYSVQFIKEINAGPFETPNNIAIRFGVNAEHDREHWRVPISQRFQKLGERDHHHFPVPMSRSLVTNLAGITDHDQVTMGRAVDFKLRHSSREHIRLLVPQAKFTAYLGPSIADMADRHVLNGIQMVEFTDPDISQLLDSHVVADKTIITF